MTGIKRKKNNQGYHKFRIRVGTLASRVELATCPRTGRIALASGCRSRVRKYDKILKYTPLGASARISAYPSLIKLSRLSGATRRLAVSGVLTRIFWWAAHLTIKAVVRTESGSHNLTSRASCDHNGFLSGWATEGTLPSAEIDPLLSPMPAPDAAKRAACAAALQFTECLHHKHPGLFPAGQRRHDAAPRFALS